MQAVLQDENGRLRSGWRVTVFLVLFFIISGMLVVGEQVLVSFIQTDQATARQIYIVVNSSGLLITALVLGALAGRVFEQLPFRSIGASFTRGWLRHLSAGLLLGAFALVVAVVIGVAAGGQRFALNLGYSGSMAISLLVGLAVFSLAAAWEEAFFRGYIFQTLTRSGLAWLAIILTSCFFGVVHLANPNATAISASNTVLAGGVFGIAYLKTRDLWFPWGLHLMWNWMQGSVFGIEVSGTTYMTPAPLLTEFDTGPAWLTGSEYGIEGGIACTIALIGVAGAIYFMPLKPDPRLASTDLDIK
jgi:membrane protease YdiL (CAAX protease family)